MANNRNLLSGTKAVLIGASLLSCMLFLLQSTLTSAGSTTLVINEVLYHASGGETNEFIEIYVQSSPGNVSGYKLTDQDAALYTFPSFTPSAGEYIVIHTGSGIDDTTGPVYHLYWGRGSAVWNDDGDDVLLQNASNVCVDYIAYETGSAIDPTPDSTNCPWGAPNPNNGNTAGTSISLKPNGSDSDSGNNWYKSGTGGTIGPTSEGANNEQATYVVLSRVEAAPAQVFLGMRARQFRSLAASLGNRAALAVGPFALLLVILSQKARGRRSR